MRKFSFLLIAIVGIFLLVRPSLLYAAKCAYYSVDTGEAVCSERGADDASKKTDCESLGGVYSSTDVCPELPKTQWCFCSDNVSDIKEANYSTADTNFISTCERALKCEPSSVKRIGSGGTKYAQCQGFGTESSGKTVCDAAKSAWEAKKAEAIKKFGGFVSGQKSTSGLSKIIPDCALQNEQGPDSPCRDATIFVAMGINIATYLFSIIGALALLMFVYGGITLAISMGSPEKIKKGGEIIMYAVLGLVIVFGAYILVKFLGEALGVTSNLL